MDGSTTQGLESVTWVQKYYAAANAVLWNCKHGGELTEVLTITYDEEVPTGTLKQIDEKFIPDTIARVG